MSLDASLQAVSTVEVCGEQLVQTRHTLLVSTQSEEEDSDNEREFKLRKQKMYTKGSFIHDRKNNHDPSLVSCFRELVLKYLPDNDKIVFCSEIIAGKDQRYYFFLITCKRGDLSIPIVLMASQEDDQQIKLLLGIAIIASVHIEFKGRGMFGISFNSTEKTRETLYFEAPSLHSMWSAVSLVEKLRDDSKSTNTGIDFEDLTRFMEPYFPEENKIVGEVTSSSLHLSRGLNRNGSSGGSEVIVVDPEEEGEGGSTILISSSTTAETEPIRKGRSHTGSITMFTTCLFESEIGIGQRLFSLSSLKRNIHSSRWALNTSPRHGGTYHKPDLEILTSCIFEFISSSPDADLLSVHDVLNHLKSTFGDPIIGKFGYSSAMIDGIVFRAIGQLEPPSQIGEKLYLGSEFNAANKAELKRLGITHILNVTVEVDKFFPDEFKYHQVCVLDRPTANILPYFERAIQFVEMGVQNGAVLVHCQRGVSRSASFVIAYLMKENSFTSDEAIKFVKQKRRIVKPNTGFIKQLAEWEKDLKE